MPTTRKRRSRQRNIVTLASLDIGDLLDLLSAWSPPRTDFDRGRTRWRTWSQYFETYLAVKDEMIERWPDGDFFAEKALRAYREDPTPFDNGEKWPPFVATEDDDEEVDDECDSSDESD